MYIELIDHMFGIIILSCSSNSSIIIKSYDPIFFLKKYDPSGQFIRKYLPALKNFPDEFIYEPWKASLQIQTHSKCILGTDYPTRIISNEEIKQTFKTAQRLLKKNHNVEIKHMSLTFKEDFENEIHTEELSRSPPNINEKFSVCPEENHNKNGKFRVSQKKSTLKNSVKDQSQPNLAMNSRERIIFQNDKNLNDIQEVPILKVRRRKPKKFKEDHLLQVNTQNARKLAFTTINTNNTGQTESKRNNLSVMHFTCKKSANQPQLAWHQVNKKLVFVEKCNGLEKRDILRQIKTDKYCKIIPIKDLKKQDRMKSMEELSKNLTIMAESKHQKRSLITSPVVKSENPISDLENSEENESMKDSSWDGSSIEANSQRSRILSSKINKNLNRRIMKGKQISILKSVEEESSIVICHVTVDSDDMDKPVEFEISNKGNDKKIIVYTKDTDPVDTINQTIIPTKGSSMMEPKNISNMHFPKRDYDQFSKDTRSKLSSNKRIKFAPSMVHKLPYTKQQTEPLFYQPSKAKELGDTSNRHLKQVLTWNQQVSRSEQERHLEENRPNK